MKVIAIFDNQGETLDRYTIVMDDYTMFGASEEPQHPLGFGQYVGDTNPDTVKDWTRTGDLGFPTNEENLPIGVKKYIEYLCEPK